MAASRASSIRALSRLAAGSKQVRQLHITGQAEYASPLLTRERSAGSLPRDIASAKEAIDKASKRPTAEASASSKPVRHFNTTRSLKAVNDSSTIDFAYLPTHEVDADAAVQTIRVPLLPQTDFTPMRTGGVAMHEVDVPVDILTTAVSPGQESHTSQVMRPEIVTASADSTHISAPSAMHEVHDNSAMDIDFHGMAERTAATVKKMESQVEEQAGVVKQLWNGLLDDVFGSKQKASKA